MKRLSLSIVLVFGAVLCSAQEVPVSGYFRDAQGALRALQGVEGAWTAPIVVPEGVLSAGYSGKTLWYKSVGALHVRTGESDWAVVAAPGGPAQATFDRNGDLEQVSFPESGSSARWDPAAAELGELEARTVEAAPEQIAPGLFILRDGERLLGQRAGGEPFALPLADPPLFQLYIREADGAETLVTDGVTFPATAPGETADVRFRLRNPGTTAVTISRLSIEVSAFRIVNQFFPPHVLAAAGFADFSVRFAPTQAGDYGATLVVNDLRVGVRGGSTAAALVELEGQTGWKTLVAGETVDLGTVERRATMKRRVRVTPAALVTLTGDKFTLAATSDPTISEISFSSETAATATAVLSVGTRRFTLGAIATEFPLPRPSIATPPGNLDPATQQKVLIRLSEAARTVVLGSAKLTFTPQSGQPDDSAIAFLPQMIRTIPLQFAVGATETEVTFQTGTTAGTIVLRVDIGNNSSEVGFILAARPLTLTATKASSVPEVVLTGFDNTRSISKVAFTWYLKSGQAAAPGRMDVDVASQFREFFAKNPGGTFQLRATFTVSGTASELAGVEVEITSAQGVLQTGRLRVE